MSSTDETLPTSPTAQDLLRRNYSLNLLYQSALTFGTSMISAGVIIPLFISNLSQDPFWVGLIMTLSFAGWMVPQLFTAPLIARFKRIKSFLIPSVLLAERLPLLLWGPAIWLLTRDHPQLMLGLFFVLLAWNTFGSGFTAVGMQELYARIIPVEKRGRLAGIAGAVGLVLGLVGAAVNQRVLGSLEFPANYALLFGLAGILGLLAWFCLTLVREPESAAPAPSAPSSYASFFRKIPGLLRSDPNFTRFLGAMAVLYFGGMSGNFLAVAAKERFGLAESVIVTFPVAMYIGQALGNLACGWIADRWGYKILQVIANAANVLLLAAAALAPAPWIYYVIFALKGISIAADVLGGMITLEFSAPELRPTYIGIYNTASGIVFIFSPVLAGWLARQMGYPSLFWITAAITALGIALLVGLVRDPRRKR